MDKQEEDPTEGQDQVVRQSKHKNKGRMGKYKDYSLMMNDRQKARGDPCPAIICNGLMFFLVEDLCNVKPVAEEDRKGCALGVALVHYYLGAGIKKFWERGEAGVTKELTQMHDMDVF